MSSQAVWVFGYGSLMWNPGFEHEEREIARLDGFSRSFCMHSIHHRGTPEEPGLVLALDRVEEARCEGVAFKVRRGAEDATISYLRERELISSAYIETTLDIHLRDGRCVKALTYIVDTDHNQYCGGMALESQAKIIARAVGQRGANTEYLFNTVAHLEELGLHDPDLIWLRDRVRKMTI